MHYPTQGVSCGIASMWGWCQDKHTCVGILCHLSGFSLSRKSVLEGWKVEEFGVGGASPATPLDETLPTTCHYNWCTVSLSK